MMPIDKEEVSHEKKILPRSSSSYRSLFRIKEFPTVSVSVSLIPGTVAIFPPINLIPFSRLSWRKWRSTSRTRRISCLPKILCTSVVSGNFFSFSTTSSCFPPSVSTSTKNRWVFLGSMNSVISSFYQRIL